MECYEPRRQRFLGLRDSGNTKRTAILEDLRRRAWTAAELQIKYGMNYAKWIRDLKMVGHPIWRKRVGMGVLYYLESPEE